MLTGQEIYDADIVHGAINKKIDNGIIPSYGLDGCGYTLRVEGLHKIASIPAMSYLRFTTYETIFMPNDKMGLLYLKSTYSRQGLILVTNSPVDPGYDGVLTIILFNPNTYPVQVYLDGGVAMLVVHELSHAVESYNGRWKNV